MRSAPKLSATENAERELKPSGRALTVTMCIQTHLCRNGQFLPRFANIQLVTQAQSNVLQIQDVGSLVSRIPEKYSILVVEARSAPKGGVSQLTV
jgi:hypothetical protein